MNLNYKNHQQNEVRKFWDAGPCDSKNSQLDANSVEYFLEIEKDRYLHQDHIIKTFDWINFNSKKVLEIGTGVGTDARQLIKRGAIYHGINIDDGSSEITKKAFQLFNLNGRVNTMNATEIDFDSEYFDVVYSFGVLHHIPEVSRAISEIHRIIKPGGYLLFMVYNKSSINYNIEIKYLRKWFLLIIKIPLFMKMFGILGFPTEKLIRHVHLYQMNKIINDDEWLSRNTDGPDNPYSVVYDSMDIQSLLGNSFKIIKNEVYFFDWRHWGVVGRLIPKIVVNFLGKKWGWHRVVLAEKKTD